MYVHVHVHVHVQCMYYPEADLEYSEGGEHWRRLEPRIFLSAHAHAEALSSAPFPRAHARSGKIRSGSRASHTMNVLYAEYACAD